MLPRIRSAALLAFATLLSGSCPSFGSNCAGTSTGLIPLTDLGAGSYQGVQGGLYPGGSSHRPFAHDYAGVSIAHSIVPLDTFGTPDPANGRVVLISIGMSNATQEFSAFVPKANADPMRDPRVLVVDCAQGGQAAGTIKYPSASYWNYVASRLRSLGSSPAQAQIVWIKEANAGPTGNFATSSALLTANLGSIVRIIHAALPHVRLAYFTSRIYAGYATSTLNPEPYAYESGFAVKALIAAQIAGEDSLNFDPARGAVEAPWLAWGPYLWADGLTPRLDGLTWACADFSSDGTHPATSARNRVADSLLAFFRADDTTRPWYVRDDLVGVTQTTPPATMPSLVSMRVRPAGPHPSGTPLRLSITVPDSRPVQLEIVDAAGRRVASPRSCTLGFGTHEVVLTETAGLRAGVYFARIVGETAVRGTRVVVVW